MQFRACVPFGRNDVVAEAAKPRGIRTGFAERAQQQFKELLAFVSGHRRIDIGSFVELALGFTMK